MAKTKISQKYQVVIPKSIRTRLKLHEGQDLNVYALDDAILLTPTKKWPDEYLGSQKDIWGAIDIAQYLSDERGSWEETK